MSATSRVPVATIADDSTSHGWPSSSATASRVAIATSRARWLWPAGPWLRALEELVAGREGHRRLGLALAAAHHDRRDRRSDDAAPPRLRGSARRPASLATAARGRSHLVVAHLHDRDDPVVDVDVVARERQRLDVAHHLLGRLARGGEHVHLGRHRVRAGHDARRLDALDVAQRVLELGQQAQGGHERECSSAGAGRGRPGAVARPATSRRGRRPSRVLGRGGSGAEARRGSRRAPGRRRFGRRAVGRRRPARRGCSGRRRRQPPRAALAAAVGASRRTLSLGPASPARRGRRGPPSGRGRPARAPRRAARTGAGARSGVSSPRPRPAPSSASKRAVAGSVRASSSPPTRSAPDVPADALVSGHAAPTVPRPEGKAAARVASSLQLTFWSRRRQNCHPFGRTIDCLVISDDLAWDD